jgi:outer membrane protein assembly factor BamB
MAGLSGGTVVYIGVKGTVVALDSATGDEVWQTELKGSQFVNLVLNGGDLFATTRGEVFCLDARTGRLRWHNPLRGFGWGLVTIATPANSGGNSAPSAMAEQLTREQQQTCMDG